MAYRMTYENTLGEGSYQPDKKDRNLARRLGAQNPYVGAGQIFSIQGREFISRRGTPYDPNARSNNTTRFERYNRPAPKTAPIPAPKPAPAAAAPAPAAAPRPQPAQAVKANIKAPTAQSAANLTVGNRPTTVSGPSIAQQVQKGIEAFKASEATRLAKLEEERKAAEAKKARAAEIAARPNTVAGQQALKITGNIGAQLPGMGGFDGGVLSNIRSKLLNI